MTPTPELREEVARAIMNADKHGGDIMDWYPEADAAIAATLAWVNAQTPDQA
jgi:hypothetical protein